MSQLVFQSTLGGSITFIGADTGNAYTVAVPAQSGTLLFQDGSNNFTVQNLIVNGTSTFYGASTFTVPVTFAGFTSTADAVFSGTGEITIPVGTTAQRSATPTVGMLRYNSTLTQFEGYNGTQWGQIGGGATGGGNDQVFFLNSQVVTTSYTIPSGKNAMSAGQITLNSGVVVTVPANGRWVIV